MNQEQPWPTIEIKGWRHFIDHATSCVESGGGFAYRGQANESWGLRPTLLRFPLSGATTSEILALERQVADEFRAQAHLHIGSEHLPGPKESAISWWALMQHYGAPTRLLDWTQSPYVAAYFAVEQNPRDAGVVFVADVTATQAHLNAGYAKEQAAFGDWGVDLLRENAPDALAFWSPSLRRSARAVAQQGIFSVAINVAADHRRILDASMSLAKRSALEPMSRWIFPARLKNEMLRNLRTANIAAHSLFPGLDGLGRSMGEVARLGRSAVIQTISLPHIESTSRVFRPSVAEMAADAGNRMGEGLFGKPAIDS